MRRFDDPPTMPGTSEPPADRFARTGPLLGTPGQHYVERRGVPVTVAEEAGVRFDPQFDGRPAVVVPMRDAADTLTALHGRYLTAIGAEDKMLTVGVPGGAVPVRGGWRAEPLILVEGLFDALSLAVCGWGSVATIGRWAPFLAEVSAGRTTWLAFDGNRPGEAEVARFTDRLPEARVRRLPPPDRCKDWSTALGKRGTAAVSRWVADRVR